jgi:hypothetical protein
MPLVTVTVPTKPKIITTTKKVVAPSLALDELTDVDAATVANGYGLIYDAVEGKWVAAPIEGALAGDIDGGIF